MRLERDFTGAHAGPVSTQGDTGPTAKSADEEPEFPGPGPDAVGAGGFDDLAGGFDDLLWESGEAPDVGPPEFGPEWWPERDMVRRDASGGRRAPLVPGAREGWHGVVEAYEPVAGEEWGRTDARGAMAASPVSAYVREQQVQLPDREDEFTLSCADVESVPDADVDAPGRPVSMLTEWFGEPDTVPAAPLVEHELPSGTRRMTRRQLQATTHHPADEDSEDFEDFGTGGVGRGLTSGIGDFVALVVLPVLVFVALLYVFGAARAGAMSDHLGFDRSVLDRDAYENLRDGLRPLYRPLVVVVGTLLAVRVVHPRVVSWARRHRRIGAAGARLLRCAWFAVPTGVWAALRERPDAASWWSVWMTGSVAVGVVVTAYGMVLARRLGAHRRSGDVRVRVPLPSVVLTAAVVVLCLVWASASYGHVAGRAQGRGIVRELPYRTGVVLYSERDLRMRGDDGIRVEEQTGASYRYRYTGLRLLRRSSGTLFLLPEGWSSQRPRLLVVHEDARLRVEYERTR